MVISICLALVSWQNNRKESLLDLSASPTCVSQSGPHGTLQLTDSYSQLRKVSPVLSSQHRMGLKLRMMLALTGLGLSSMFGVNMLAGKDLDLDLDLVVMVTFPNVQV